MTQTESPITSAEQIPALAYESGCLTPAGLETVRRAAPGEAPKALADHLAACDRCQMLLLNEGDRPRRRHTQPPMWRLVFAVFMMLLALATLSYVVYWLASP